MKHQWGLRVLCGGCRSGMAALLLTQALLTAPVLAADRQENNLRLYGALVAEPCVIPPGDEEIHLDFGTVIDDYLYLNTRTLSQRFEIRLAECDLSLGQTVKVIFLGTENAALPGLLAIDGSRGASGIAIGLETQQSTPLPLNKPSGVYPLQAGDTRVALQAYVQGEPTALAQRHIGRGPFSATATFRLEYE